MRILKSTTVILKEKIKKGKHIYFKYECFCGSAGETRADYVHKIKSCKKCQFKCTEQILDSNLLWCGTCATIKNKSDFCIRKDGTKRSCKNCEQKYRQKNAEQQKQYCRIWLKDNPERRLLLSAKKRAKVKNLPFNLELKDIIIPDFCPVLNIKLDKNKANGDKTYSPSIDRIDSTKGYTVDNIKVISWRANWLKNNGTLEEFEQLLKYIRGYSKK